MRYSRTFKSSIQSLPSNDGAHIATILPSTLSIRSTRSLETSRVIALPPELAASVSWFSWSTSSTRVLVASTDNIRVYSTLSPQFKVNITNPTSGTARITFVSFGITDNEVCVFSEFGLKLTVFNLQTSRSVDINSPKFFNPGVAPRGFCYRPGTLNLTLLTRSGGKDIISIHARDTLEITRSWLPETIDAQGLRWSPDGRWLIVWESAGQGHKIIVHTADGHLYKIWNGPRPVLDEDRDIDLGPGVRLLDWSRTGTYMAVGDYSTRITLLTSPSFTQYMSLHHTMSIQPSDTLQMWQEQMVPSQTGGMTRSFVQGSQTICLPTTGSPPAGDGSLKTGPNMIAFDNSGTLLATRIENLPTTTWIWDMTTKILRAVLIMHAPVAKISWHPAINELLMIRCEGEESKALVYLWDPSWESPKIVDFGRQMPGGKIIGKSIVRWLNVETAAPVMFFSDSQDCVLVSVSDPADEEDLPWQDAISRGFDIYGQREESPLNLVESDIKRPYRRVPASTFVDEDESMTSGTSDEVEDTFRFRKFVEPATSPGVGT